MLVLGCLLLALVSCHAASMMMSLYRRLMMETLTLTPLYFKPTLIPCENGIPSGAACCSESCGTCGGQGCYLRPGGGPSCCVGRILSSQNSCLMKTAHCQIPSSDTTCCTGVLSGNLDYYCPSSCRTCGEWLRSEGWRH